MSFLLIFHLINLITTNSQNTPILYFNGTIYGHPDASDILCRNGTIHSTGKQEDFNADFTVLDNNLLGIHPEEIDALMEALTVVNGETVYSE